MQDWLLSFGAWLENSPMAYAVVNWGVLADIVTVSHYFSFFLVVGTSATVDLRLLGLAGRRQTASQLADQLFPWTWTALGIAVLSGFLYLAPSATAFFRSSFFFIKLLVTLLAGVFVLLIQRNVRKWDQQPATPPWPRPSAARTGTSQFPCEVAFAFSFLSPALGDNELYSTQKKNKRKAV